MDDVQEICDRFLDGDAVILYFEQAEEKIRSELWIFLSGAIYSQNGNILRYQSYLCDFPRKCGTVLNVDEGKLEAGRFRGEIECSLRQ